MGIFQDTSHTHTQITKTIYYPLEHKRDSQISNTDSQIPNTDSPTPNTPSLTPNTPSQIPNVHTPKYQICKHILGVGCYKQQAINVTGNILLRQVVLCFWQQLTNHDNNHIMMITTLSSYVMAASSAQCSVVEDFLTNPYQVP